MNKFRDKLLYYKDLRLNTVTQPRYRHVLLLGFWVWYFAMYFLTEKLIPYENCNVMHCAVDDLIPFCEYGVIFYCFWYVLIFGSLIYFFFWDIKSFTNLQLFIGFTQIVAMICYVVSPSIQDLRPASFERDNIFTRVLGFIYAFDTPTGVCPSLHVGYTCGIVSTYLKKKDFPLWLRLTSVALLILISLSTCLVKQHSFIDVCFGLVDGLIAEACIFIIHKIKQARAKARA